MAPSHVMSCTECVLSTAATLAAFIGPLLLKKHAVPAAAAWAAAHLLAAVAGGTTSPVWWCMRVRTAAAGPLDPQPRLEMLLLAVVLEACLVLSTAGVGVAVSLACRLLTVERQSFADRLLRLAPMREVTRSITLGPIPLNS